jgi:hypothetical protein
MVYVLDNQLSLGSSNLIQNLVVQKKKNGSFLLLNPRDDEGFFGPLNLVLLIAL